MGTLILFEAYNLIINYHFKNFNPVWQHTFVSPSAFSRRAVVSYWRKYVYEVLVNRLGGLSLPRKRVVRLTGRPDMTLDVYHGRKTTIQYQYDYKSGGSVVDNTLDYQSRDRKIDPPLLRFSDETLNRGPVSV